MNTANIDSARCSVEHQARMLEYDLISERLQPYIVDMTKPLPDIEPLISIDGCCVCSRGNISAICGEAKSRKTFLATALVASAMAIPYSKLDNFSNVSKDMNINVLWADTEQGEQHVRRVISRITQMTGAAMGGAIVEPRLTTLALRELAPHERKNMIYDAMRLRHYDIVVIDGVADLQRNTNDLEESDALVDELMKLSTQANTHIISVLHTNPGSDKARGHLGSSLQRKCEAVLFVHRDGECTIVEPQFCRNEPFERFAFTVSEEGIPRLAELPKHTEERNAVVAVLEDAYGGSIERITLVNKLVETLGIEKHTAQMRVRRLISKGVLVERDGLINVANSPTVVNVSNVQNSSNVVNGSSVVNSSWQGVMDYDDTPF
ncbi:MAG: AAA family ATPase [Alistipes sp.]|nr:AAA family ATPase [Alistipes sp.]